MALMGMTCQRAPSRRRPPAIVITAMMMTPVMTSRTPAPKPEVLSSVTTMNRNSDAPQRPGRLAEPPATEVPPMTTTAMELSRYSDPISSEDPPVKPASRAPHRLPRVAHST